jgi:UDP-N-acetyl-D-mannosaminuronic acid transferase (WecB/TagA/CpsF family)
MNAGDLVFTDGVPVVWAARKLHPNHNWERVDGPDVTTWILENQELGKNSKTP